MIKQLIATTLLSISPLTCQPKQNKKDSTNEPILTTPYKANEQIEETQRLDYNESQYTINQESHVIGEVRELTTTYIQNVSSNEIKYLNIQLNQATVSYKYGNDIFHDDRIYFGSITIIKIIPYLYQLTQFNINLFETNLTNPLDFDTEYRYIATNQNVENIFYNIENNYKDPYFVESAIISVQEDIQEEFETATWIDDTYQTYLPIYFEDIQLFPNTPIYLVIITETDLDATTYTRIDWQNTYNKYVKMIEIEQTIPQVVDYEGDIIDLPGLMFQILGMPFAFISQAFNVTLFPNTPYQVNISNIFLTLIAILLFLWLIKLILGKADIGSFIADQKDSYTKQNNKNKKANKDNE